MARIFTVGFSKAAFSPEAFFFNGVESSLLVRKTEINDSAHSRDRSELVISVDKLFLGSLPESLLPVVALAIICVLVSLVIAPFII